MIWEVYDTPIFATAMPIPIVSENPKTLLTCSQSTQTSKLRKGSRPLPRCPKVCRLWYLPRRPLHPSWLPWKREHYQEANKGFISGPEENWYDQTIAVLGIWMRSYEIFTHWHPLNLLFGFFRSKSWLFWQIISLYQPRWPLEHIQQALYAK